jgi:hypothetical protein
MTCLPEQDYSALLSIKIVSDKNPFGKSVNPVAKPVITSTIHRSITPKESTIVVQEIANLLDSFSGRQYAEVLRWLLEYIQESKKFRKRFRADDTSAILMLIESFCRIDQTFALRKKGGQSCF